eukprot:1874125-Lingulodinium_polyedra.AAC.1
MLLVVGGSPCQQLSTTGPDGGRLGLAGGQSVLFYAIPAIASAASQFRPDLEAHALCENVASALL